MDLTLIDPSGNVIENPSQTAIAQALDELLNGADADADLWLETDEGWALSVVPSRDIFFENLNEGGSSYQTLGPLPRDHILRLLHLLSQNKLAELRAEPWESGE